MIFLVYEIHPLNFPLFWLLSFFVEIKAYKINPYCDQLARKRIELVNREKYLSVDDIYCIRSQHVALIEDLLKNFPVKSWQITYHGSPIDFSGKAKKDLAVHLEAFSILKEIQGRLSTVSDVYLIGTRHTNYLKHIEGALQLLSFRTSRFITLLNVISDVIQGYFVSLARLSLFSAQIIIGCLWRLENAHSANPTRIIWDAVLPNEIELSKDKRCFHWIVDGTKVRKENVLFILPNKVDEDWKKKLTALKRDSVANGFRAYTLSDVYKLIPASILFPCFIRSSYDLLKLIFLFFWTAEVFSKVEYFLSIQQYDPLIRYFRPKCYVTAFGAMANEKPVIVYLNSLNIKTVMYCLGSNSYLFTQNGSTCDFRWIPFTNILSEHLITWNKNYKDFVESHSQIQLNILPLGPLMPGYQDILVPGSSTNSRMVSVRDRKDFCGLKFIAVFDEAPISRALGRLYPSHNTDAYCLAFFQDIVTLLESFDGIVIAYKPQRSLTRSKFSYVKEFHELVRLLKHHKRGIVLEDDINPWEPIALADMGIGIPFTSPVLACLHYGKPAIFHDPTGIVVHHKYQALGNYMTHDYSELRSKVSCLLFDHPPNKETLWSEASEYIGQHRGVNSSERFREFLLQ